MTRTTIMAGTLTASVHDRVIGGLLLPYNEVGSTNLGRFSVPSGVAEYPEDISVMNANLDHSQLEPVARFESLTDTPLGIFASFKVAAGKAGDLLLAGIADKVPGARNALSAEASVEIKGGKATKVKLFGAAFVAAGAFPSARLLMAALDTPTDPDPGSDPEDPDDVEDEVVSGEPEYREVVTTEITTPGGTTTIVDETQTTVTEQPATEPTEQEENLMATAKTRPAAAGGNILKASASDMYARLAAGANEVNGGGMGVMKAALTDILSTAAGSVGKVLTVPQWIGELWEGRAYDRLYMPVFNSGELTSTSAEGWRWKVKPAVQKYAGNKSDVPSIKPEAERDGWEIVSFAGANDIDIAMKHFAMPEFWESYYRAMTESYAEVSDLDFLAQVELAATDVAPGVVPAGMAPGWVYLIDGAIACLKSRILPTFAYVSLDLYRDMALTKERDSLEFLNAALGLEEGSISEFKFIPAPDIDLDTVYVGSSHAITVREMPGAPVRVDAFDISRGGIDEGFFGYYMAQIDKPDAVVRVSANGIVP